VNEIHRFVQYCDENHMELNVKKTTEMIVDFRKSRKVVPELVVIKGSKIERVREYKYLGVMIDEKLNFNAHIEYIESKLKSRLDCLRNFNHLKVDSRILTLFYNSAICSIYMDVLFSLLGRELGGRDEG
jgi:hypothetical protein